MDTENNYIIQENKFVCDTIINQLGGEKKLKIFTGCKIIYDLENTSVDLVLPRASKGLAKTLRIKYIWGVDLYNITSFNVHRRVLKEIERVYFDDLISLFETLTGYFITFHSSNLKSMGL